MKRNYWKEDRISSLCKEYSSANDRRKVDIINELTIPLKEMFYNIAQRYFTINPSLKNDLLTDCLTACLTNVQNYNPNYKAFSYFQTIIRNTLHNHSYRNKIYSYHRHVECSEDIENYSNESLNNLNNSNHILKAELISELENRSKVLKDYALIIDSMISFITNHDDYFIIDLVIYLLNKYDYSKVRYVFKKLFFYTLKTLEYYKSIDSNESNKCSIEEYYNDNVSKINNYYIKKSKR